MDSCQALRLAIWRICTITLRRCHATATVLSVLLGPLPEEEGGGAGPTATTTYPVAAATLDAGIRARVRWGAHSTLSAGGGAGFSLSLSTGRPRITPRGPALSCFYFAFEDVVEPTGKNE